jgi:ribosome biogenesis GTPase
VKIRADAATEQDGRVIASHGRDAVVLDRTGCRTPCRLQGRRLAVVCGDRVRWILASTEGAMGLITGVLPRSTVLARISQRGEAEAVAANLSQLITVVAPMPVPDFGLCDRYLAAAAWAGLKACIVANKSDIADTSGALAALDDYVRIGYPVVRASKRIADGARELALRLSGETSVLVGQSGAGKSSLINLLVPGVHARVDEVTRATESGRHTTSTSSLYQVPTGGELIDSPGVRDFAPPLPAPRDIAGGFREIAAAAPGCRFADCLHGSEPGCAVTVAAGRGAIAARRLASYRQLLALAREMAARTPRITR